LTQQSSPLNWGNAQPKGSNILKVLKFFTAILTLLPFVFGAAPTWALIEYTDSQRETIAELIEQLEDRHYAKLRYDDLLSSQHLDSYLDNLDATRMFFLAADIEEFEKYRTRMDDDLPRGKLDAGFNIFNRFKERVEHRLNAVVDGMPEFVAALNFERDESYRLDSDGRQWASSDAELDERWRKHIKHQALSLKLADKAEEEIPETLGKRYSNQLKRVQQYNAQDTFQIYANALTRLYDPHSNYLSPRRSENFNINMSLSLEGIGAVLQLEEEYTKVIRLVAKGPADKQGDLQPSDRIVGVGQDEDGPIEDVVGWRLDEVVQLIRGPKGSTVRLEVIPAKAKSTGKREIITIVRNEVKLEEQSAQKEILEIPNGEKVLRIGVIDIPAFYIDFAAMRRGEENYKSTSRDVRRLLGELQEEDIDGLVVDLRNNGGGSLQEANDLTGLFIEYGPTVQIRHSSRSVWREGKSLKSNYYEGPMLVLINRLSASASEIFAGAMQDYERAIIVGDRSYGKGTVQTMIPLSEGQLKVTESKFNRNSGDSTQHRGVVPDVEFPSIFDPDEIGESSLDHALSWDQINPVRHHRYNDLNDLIPQLTLLSKDRSQRNPDFVFLEEQVELAMAAREMEEITLNEQARIALRDDQEAKALAIENRRRKGKGEELLTSLESDEDEESDADAEDAAEDEDNEPDVLLTEAGNILVDALILKRQAYAINTDI
jgi:carboxyl-terminal processing protease